MSEKWKILTLDEVCERIYSGGTPSTANKSYWNGNLNWLSSGETGNRYIEFTDKKITEEGVANSSTKFAHKDSIVIASAGQGNTRGQTSYLLIDTYVNQSVIVLKPDTTKIDPKFLFFNLSNRYKELRKYSDESSTRGSLSGNILKKLKLQVPPIDKQKPITKFLVSLDDKIEINKKILQNFESQVQTVYNEWFVNKYEKYSIKTLGNVTVNNRMRVTDNNTPVFSAVNTGNLKRSDDYFSKQVYSKDIRKYILVKTGDFAYNPARVNIGSIGINDLGYDGCVSPVYVAFSVDPDYRSFFKYFIKSNKFKEEAKTRASGSVRQSLNYSDFAKIEIKYPPRELAKQFEVFHSTIEDAKRKIEKEIETLISLRDTLLPKLMNGEIEVDKMSL